MKNITFSGLKILITDSFKIEYLLLKLKKQSPFLQYIHNVHDHGDGLYPGCLLASLKPNKEAKLLPTSDKLFKPSAWIATE